MSTGSAVGSSSGSSLSGALVRRLRSELKEARDELRRNRKEIKRLDDAIRRVNRDLEYRVAELRRSAEQSLKVVNDRLGANIEERNAELDRQQQSLEEQRQTLQTTLRSVAEGVLVVDRFGRVQHENPAAARIVGYSVLDTDAADWCEAVGAHAPDGTALLALQDRPTRRALNGVETQGTELVLRGKDRDRSVRVEVRAAPLRRRDGEIIGAILNFNDISQRTRAAEVEARLAALVRSTRAAVITWTSDGTVVDWNEGAAGIFGYSADEICGRSIAVLSMAGERRLISGGADAAESLYDRELRMRHKDGRPVHVAWTVASVLDATGRLVGAAGIGTDVSERTYIEREVALLADEKRQQLGRDLHDSLGQQVTALGLLSNVLSERLRSNVPVADIADKIESGIETAKAQLLSIAKGLSPVDIGAQGLIAALFELAENTRRTHGIDCHVQCVEPVAIDDVFAVNQLYLISREAVHNAVKHARAREIVIGLEASRGVELTVIDDGIGIGRAEDRQPESGMGLRIMRYRARLIGADIKIERGTSGGTVLRCTCGSATGLLDAPDSFIQSPP